MPAGEISPYDSPHRGSDEAGGGDESNQLGRVGHAVEATGSRESCGILRRVARCPVAPVILQRFTSVERTGHLSVRSYRTRPSTAIAKNRPARYTLVAVKYRIASWGCDLRRIAPPIKTAPSTTAAER